MNRHMFLYQSAMLMGAISSSGVTADSSCISEIKTTSAYSGEGERDSGRKPNGIPVGR